MFAPRAFVFAPAALMMIVCAALFAPAMAVAEQGTPMPEIDNSDWAAFLTTYRREGSDGVARVAYADVSDADHAALKAYIDQLEQIDPGALGEDEAFAYWVNLYNAVTIDVVLDNYPVRSIRNINSGIRPGPWRRKLATVKGEDLSLDDIEHEILRKEWSDNRVHYAVNCASIGCPDLAAEPFTGARLDEMLDAAARAYVNHPRGVRVESGRIIASSIYDWFKEDFGGNHKGILEHLRQYADEDLAAELEGAERISRFSYDWKLNDAEE